MGTDTATLIERSARLRVDDLDLGLFHEQRLDSAALRCLRYVHDVEGHTMCYLRDVLVTKAHRDPDVTAFLACWSYEESTVTNLTAIQMAWGAVTGRLGTSRLSQRITRGALERFWKPVGSGLMPPGEVRFLVSHLFGDEEGERAAQRIDRHVDRFPGLEGLHLVEKAVTQMSREAA